MLRKGLGPFAMMGKRPGPRPSSPPIQGGRIPVVLAFPKEPVHRDGDVSSTDETLREPRLRWRYRA